MNNIKFLSVATALTIFCGCSEKEVAPEGQPAAEDAVTESVITPQQADSLSELFGLLSGHDATVAQQRLIDAGAIDGIDREAFMRGVTVALSGNSAGYTQGVDGSHTIISWIVETERRTGKKINIEKFIEGLQSTLCADFISTEEAAKIAEQYSELYQRSF